MDNQYRFDEGSYQAVEVSGVDLPAVAGALYGTRPRIRRHVGTDGLHVFAEAPDGRWLALAFVETETDDVWQLTAVRLLSEEETDDVRRALGGA